MTMSITTPSWKPSQRVIRGCRRLPQPEILKLAEVNELSGGKLTKTKPDALVAWAALRYGHSRREIADNLGMQYATVIWLPNRIDTRSRLPVKLD